MQVFKVFCKVMLKHKTQFLMYIVIYMIISIAVSRSVQESKVMEFSKVSLKVAVDNRDQGELGGGLVSYLKEYNEIKKVPKNQEAVKDAMYYQEIDYVLLIPEDFTEKIREGTGEEILEGTVVPGSSTAYLIENEIKQYLDTASMYLRAGMDSVSAVELTKEDMQQEADVNYLEKSDGESLPVGFHFFRYLPYVFMVVMILGLEAVMKTFRDKDLSARNKCSAMSFFNQNVQIILGCIFFTLVVYTLFMVMALCLTGDYFFSIKGLLSAVNALVFSICAASLAWLCVQFVRSMEGLTAMSNVFSLSFSFLGGVFVSLDLMSDGVRQAAKFIPSYWYVIANNEIQKVESFAEAGSVYQSYLVVLLFALAFFAVGLLANRMKLRTAQ